ncbi:helicase-related protein [Amycolatopsis sp. NPDC048633]|uniref:helicase-related protein n=1 Tax=Amycolatopsis sp. NPDC048633 TaxID=3157095 RepID=UPI0033FB53DB
MTDRDPVGVREDLLGYLRDQYLGPASGDEEILRTKPEHTYLVGTLYPKGPAAEQLYGDSLGEDSHDEELDEPIEMANSWHPASAAVSFLHNGPELRCEVTAGTYEKLPEKDPTTRRDRWSRRPWSDEVVLSAEGSLDDNTVDLFDDRARLVCVWRRTKAAWLVTVALENLAEHDEAESPPPTDQCLFQVGFVCHVQDGRILPYPSSTDLSDDPEDQELRLMYRRRRIYGIGHGCSVDWLAGSDGEVRTVRTEMLPTKIVPGVARPSDVGKVLRMSYLADESIETETLVFHLKEFVSRYESWVVDRERESESLEQIHMPAADRILSRMRRAVKRMYSGIDLLREDAKCLLAFRLANAAMCEQALQSQHVRTHPGELGAPLMARDSTVDDPTWYHFQLGFQLLSLASTADGSHADRGVVDLIWFPTGGGKTEAYLGLAAFEMIRRRLVDGMRGGGTAVLTRYTLRLLTSQQFQRAATLICALEQLRGKRPELQSLPSFSIGLWVGGDTTPNDYGEAFSAVKEVFLAQKPKNPFQLQNCPWCGTLILPKSRRPSPVDGGPNPAYGVRATKNHFELFCPHPECFFHDILPISVVDDQIFADPPTLLLATVDKLARLPWVKDAGTVFGRGAVPFDAPSLVIQDELHLLSGPLGTTVALYEAAVHALLSWDGKTPKIVASTATIRAADHQVRSLYGGSVELFPPSGLDADSSYFARTDRNGAGRLYVGLMPQAFTQASATILSSVAILQAPTVLGLSGKALDAYWTLVIYHNSLRELGRTVTQIRDDVDTMLQARSTEATAARSLRGDGVVELTSNVHADDLPEIITRLEQSTEQRDFVDVLATTNMLSVGIDIGRLGVMLMNGQPKTTSEYIQATSRVGRSTAVPGLVVTLLRATKPRDRSHYESFRAYHESLYRYVEPTSVTPWSLASRERSLRAAFVMLIRHGVGLRRNEQAGDFSIDDPVVRMAFERLAEAARRADEDEAEPSRRELQHIAQEWHDRAAAVTERGERLYYQSKEHATLLKDFGARGEGWPVAHSMRSVDRQVRILALGEGRR